MALSATSSSLAMVSAPPRTKASASLTSRSSTFVLMASALLVLRMFNIEWKMRKLMKIPVDGNPVSCLLKTLQEKNAKNEGIQGEKERNVARHPGHPHKQPNIQGRKLFNGQSSDEEDSINGSDHDAPTVHTLHLHLSLKLSFDEFGSTHYPVMTI